MLIVLPRQNEDEVIDKDVVTGATNVVVIAEWELDGACCVCGWPIPNALALGGPSMWGSNCENEA